MSKYTTEVRYICESLVPPGTMRIDSFRPRDFIYYSRDKIFDFDYPIFDEEYKPVLETKILKHYYTREICEESYALWKLRVEDTLNLIMPYYNQLYKSELLEFNPFYDTDLTKDYHKVLDGEQNDKSSEMVDRNEERNEGTESSGRNNSNTVTEGKTKTSASGEDVTTTHSDDKNDRNSTNWDLYSDTPQGGINGIEGDGNGNGVVGDNYYLTNARKTTNNEHSEGEADGTNTTKYGRIDNGENNANVESKSGYEDKVDRNAKIKHNDKVGREGQSLIDNIEDYIEHIKGKSGGANYSRLLQEFRNTFLNIDKMIIEELEPLFFGLW